jgi:hypothetical protein
VNALGVLWLMASPAAAGDKSTSEYMGRLAGDYCFRHLQQYPGGLQSCNETQKDVALKAIARGKIPSRCFGYAMDDLGAVDAELVLECVSMPTECLSAGGMKEARACAWKAKAKR